MTLKISRVHILNYKSCVDLELNLSTYTPFVGYNNAGKSNILSSIQWFIEGKTLSHSSFYDPSKPLEVTVDIDGIDSNLLSSLDESQAKSLVPYIVDGKISVKRILTKPNGTKKELVYLVLDSADSGEWKPNPNGIAAGIKIIFPDVIHVGAMDDSEEDSTKFKTSTTLGKIISNIMVPVEVAHGDDIKQALASVREKLHVEGSQRAEEIKSFDQLASKNVEEFFPGISLKLHVPTPEIKELFKSGTIKVFESTYQKDFSQLGHGAQRSIQMGLLRYLSEVNQGGSEDSAKTILLIDEPELYLHPQAVEHLREALKTLSKRGFQVLFSTHSPQLIDDSTMPDVVLVRKSEDKGTHARRTVKEAIKEAIVELPHQTQTLFSLSNSSEILFCENVLLAEGKTEKALLPFLIKTFYNKSLGQLKLALVNQSGSGNIYKSMSVLGALDLPAKSVVDLDFAFKQAPIDGLIDAEDDDLNACKDFLEKNAEAEGIELSSDKLPTKAGRLKNASQAYEWLAQQEEIKPKIQSLHEKLLAKNIWLWKNGAIEAHLGLEGKDLKYWSELKERVNSEGIEVTCNDECFQAFLRWVAD